MLKKFFEAIIAVIPFLKQLFSKESKKKREKKKIEEKYEKQKNQIDKAIAGKDDISIVTDDILGNVGLDVPSAEKSSDH